MKNSNLLFASIATFAPKRFDRDLIEPGNYPISCRISGKIDGEKIVEAIKGQLIVNGEQSRASSKKPSDCNLVAAVLYHIEPSDRQSICNELLSSMKSDDECLKLAKHLIKNLTRTSVGLIRGSMSFDTE